MFRQVSDENRDVWIADETLSVRVSGEVNLSKSMLYKTGYIFKVHCCNILCINVMNYHGSHFTEEIYLQ